MKRKKMKLQKINKNFVSLLGVFFGLLSFSVLHAQTKEEKKAQREARAFAAEAQENLSDNNFAEAEANYRKAIARDPQNAEARYNLGNMYYSQEKNTEAGFNHKTAATTTEEKVVKHKAFHNQGNAFMKQKQYEKAVNAYKNALRNNPTDDETRYNLALAKKMLEKEQQENEQNQDNKDQNKDNQNQDQQQQNQDQKEGQNKDQEDKKSEEGDQGDIKDNQEKQEPKENEGDQKKDQQNKEQQNPKKEQGDEKKENQQPQQAKGQLSPQQIKSLLEAMENKEKEIQDKINAQKAKQSQPSNGKDW
ncbi:tetratricopeptide repeat protein [Mesonia sp. K7]|uniref:tetratricopeptide repeat protein n=1 Tax=Mesonia sp. K7 TaxID=2218606 RepID=UPI000DAA33CD|nr:tetratricopeptide repeat protein [Mesonia sp. K7]PZD79032.1 hypothetical protein DNG35_03220 [Mesonia sp. K7]